MPDAGHSLGVAAGVVLAGAVLFSALQTVVLPRGGFTGITRFVFAVADRVFVSHGHRRPVPKRFSSLYAPVALVSLPFAWCMLVTFAFALIFWGLDEGPFYDAFVVSGSSLFTLGFAKPDGAGLTWLTFVEATIGLGLVALLISFLPTLYAAYSDRERGVGLLEPLVGTPPSAVELLRRLHVAHSVDGATVWTPASEWFVALAQSHTAFPALCSFPSQQPGLSWVVTAGTVLDGAALRLSLFHGDRRVGADTRGPTTADIAPAVLVLAHGIPAMGRVARSAGLDVPEPASLIDLLAAAGDDLPTISVTRDEYERAVREMVASGVAGDAATGPAATTTPESADTGADTGLGTDAIDTDRGWRRFVWLRSGYDTAVTGLAGHTRAPAAPWTSDRALHVGRPRFFRRRPLPLDHP